MKKLFCLIFAICMLGMTGFAAPSDWAAAEVEAALEAGFVPTGFAEDWQKEIKREEFAELAVRYLAYKLEYSLEDLYIYIESQPYKVNSHTSDTTVFWKGKEGSMTFSDTNKRLIRMAADIGIIEGQGEGIFNAYKPITRQEAAVMLLRTYAAYANAVSFKADTAYADKDEIASWASLGVRFTAETGVMQGVGANTFAPLASYTREQAVLTFLRLGKLQAWEQSPGLYQKGKQFSGKPKQDLSVPEKLIEYRLTDPAYTLLEKWETPYGILLYDFYTYPETGKKEYAFIYAMHDWNMFHVLQPFWEDFGTSNVQIGNIHFNEDKTEMTCDVTVEDKGTFAFKTDLFLGETIQTGFTK